MIKPFIGNFPITQKFGVGKGYSKSCRKDGTHNGLDWGVPTGTPILSAEDGVVTQAGMDNTGYGIHIRVKNKFGGGCIYGHLSKMKVKVGDAVKEGDLLGLSGNTGNSTGAHLHFEVRTNLSICSTCLNPMLFLTSKELNPTENKVSWGSLNVRLTPSMNGKVIGQLNQSDAVIFGCGETIKQDGYTWQPILLYVAKEGLGE